MTSTVHALALAILHLVSAPSGILPDHFASAPIGPMHRATSIATTLLIAADANNLDVTLLTALDYWESGFDDNAVSSRLAFGQMQLLPRYHRDIMAYCRRHPERCQIAVINRGAEVLAHYKRACKTDARAVRAYRVGHCAPPVANTFKVLRTRKWLRSRLGAV